MDTPQHRPPTSDRAPTSRDLRPRQRAARRLAALGAGLLLLPACQAGGGGSGGEVDPDEAVATSQVAVVDDDFEPAAITVPAGTAVTWTWEGRREHDVVGDGFDSGRQVEGTFAHTFDEPGTVSYRCTIHGGMDGVVVVTAGDDR